MNWKDRLTNIICLDDEREVQSYSIAAVILCLVPRQVQKASHDKGREYIAANLKGALVKAMATIIEEYKQDSKVSSLLRQIKEDHFTKVIVGSGVNLGEVERLTSLIKQLIDIADKTNNVVLKLIRDQNS